MKYLRAKIILILDRKCITKLRLTVFINKMLRTKVYCSYRYENLAKVNGLLSILKKTNASDSWSKIKLQKVMPDDGLSCIH